MKTEIVGSGDDSLPLLTVCDTNALLDAMDPAAFAVDERLPYWADLWPSAVVLARWCKASPFLRGRSVLELGCGLGLAGITAARAGGIVTMTDYEEDALLFSRFNIAVNLAQPFPTVSHLDWRFPSGLGTFDLIIGADIVYERRNFAPLFNLFRSSLRPGGSIILTDPDRMIGRDFFAAARPAGFNVEETRNGIDWHGRMITVIRAHLRPEE